MNVRMSFRGLWRTGRRCEGARVVRAETCGRGDEELGRKRARLGRERHVGRFRYRSRMPTTNPWLKGPRARVGRAPPRHPRRPHSEPLLDAEHGGHRDDRPRRLAGGDARAVLQPRIRAHVHELERVAEVAQSAARPSGLGRHIRAARRAGVESRRQVFGTARTLERDDPEADRYWEAFRWQSDHVERGRPLTEPPADPLTVITPERIVYTEHWLRKDGYKPRQVWRPE